MIKWKIHHKKESVSTNLDALAGKSGDVFTADYQSAGRGRLDHKWESVKGENLMMSAVVAREEASPEKVATLPLVAGVAIAEALKVDSSLKWPNDVWYKNKKLAGVLCERRGDNVIIGIGLNVNAYPIALKDRSTSLKEILGERQSVIEIRDAILASLSSFYQAWLIRGFDEHLRAIIAKRDYLRGKTVSVRQTDDDSEPIEGVCEGIAEDGSLLVGGERIYAGEAHIEGVR